MVPDESASGDTVMRPDLAQHLLDLTRQRRFDDVVKAWRNGAVIERESEIPKRLAAAAFAQSGDLNAASGLLLELVSRDNVEAATCALAARVFFDLSNLAASLTAWERALALAPDNLGWWQWFAQAAIRAGQPERALRSSDAHALHREQRVDIALAYATLLTKAQRSQEALVAFERIMVRWPHHPVAGPAFAEFVLREFPLEARDLLTARSWCPAPAALSPERVRASLWLPAFFASETSAAEWRDHLLAQLGELKELARVSPLQGMERAACLATTPFFAAFHDADITAIQFAWGDFVEALVAPLRAVLPARDMSRRTIRTVGIVSNRLTDSSAGRFFNGWVAQLRGAGFELRLYALGRTDQETDRLSRLAVTHRFADDDVRHWLALSQQLLADSNDVLLFPEPQGSPLTLLVAGLRCAPIQCAAFGNPDPTGLPTMDYFLVPDAAEVDSPQAFYREAVVRLDGIGIARQSTTVVSDFTRQSFGFSDSEHIYLVNQQLQKWTPNFIEAVSEVLRRDRRGRLVYFGGGANVSARAAQMYVREAFRVRGLDIAERTSLVAQLHRADYLALNRAADVSLDTFGYGGGSTTTDALDVGLAVVSVEGRFLRSRQTAGMLRVSGQEQLIAKDHARFVELALAVAADHAPIATGGTTTTATNHRYVEGSIPIIVRGIAQFFELLNRR